MPIGRTSFLHTVAAAAVLTVCLAAPSRAFAQVAPQERLCDPTWQNCRTDLLEYIKQENVRIDAAFWLMSDDRYVSAIIARWQAGVPVRLLVDPRCDENHVTCTAALDKFRAAKVPMRYKAGGGILHWKMMLFGGQGQVQFSGANYNPFEFVPVTPYVNYTDEIIYYTNDNSIVQSFMTKFDDLWTSTTEFKDYANITPPLARAYDTYPISPDLNFPPDNSYRSRAVGRYNAETQKIDVMMFRITDVSHTNAIVKAIQQRGVPVRLITDESEYRNPDRLWDAYNVDILYKAGVQVRLDAHEGIDHAKLVLLYGQGMAIFGSSNWTSPSSDSQREHNYFTTKAGLVSDLKELFDRKWTNGHGETETKPFVPLPPTKPAYVSPANMATAQPTTGTALRWNGGLWAHVYDVYFGISPTPPLFAQDVALGPSQTSTDYKTYSTLPPLQPGTTYYWKIVSKTMAGVTNAGPVWSFTTAGTPGGGGPLPAPWLDADVGAVGAAGSASFNSPTFTVAGAGADVWGTADAFHFAYQPLDGDGTIVARVASVQNTAAWAKAGVMIRSSLSAGSAHAFMLVSPGKGAAFQRRLSNGGSSVSTAGSLSTPPRWVKLTRSGNTITAFESSNGTSWTQVASDTFSMPSSVLVGLAVSSHVSGVTSTATFDGVSVTTSAPPPPPPPLPAPWVDADVGAVGAAGSASFNSPTFTVAGAGADVWGTADAFHFVYQPLDGDGTIVARVASVQNTAAWAKAGVMIRSSLSAGSAHAFMLVSPGKGAAFQRRLSNGGSSVSTAGSLSTPPRWVKLTRSGNTITAFESSNGTSWTQVASDTFSMPSSALVGLAVSSHVSGVTSTATFDGVSVTASAPPPPPLPSGWADADIGAVSTPGTATFNGSTFSIKAQGADIWGAADAFHYAYRAVSGDTTIITRVASVQNVNAWTKAGVMIRETLDAGSTHAFALVSAAKGVAFQRRPTAGGVSVSTAGTLSTAPRWVKLTRVGDVFTAYESSAGTTWSEIGSETIAMDASVLVGLSVTSHSTSSASAGFDGVDIQ